MPEPPLYTNDQLELYFKRIKLPSNLQRFSIKDLSESEQLQYLGELQRYNLVAIPFENLSLHYSQAGTVTLHPDALFKKIVESPGRGGYCMENNRLLGTVLLTLGFRVYAAGARVKANKPSWSGFTHMVNIIIIGSRKYMVDVGFGPNGPIQPLELVKDNPPVCDQLSPSSSRLFWTKLQEHVDPDQRVWVYQFRKSEGQEWEDWYCFVEVEFLRTDYEVMNYFTSTSRKTWFTRDVICSKKSMGDESDNTLVEEIILLNGTIRWRRDGYTVKTLELKSEQDRQAALEEYFNILLGPEEKDAIRGLGTQLNG